MNGIKNKQKRLLFNFLFFGIGFFLLCRAFPVSASAETGTPMYRLYNPNSGEHFYTASAYERDNVIRAGWNDEGIGWYAPLQSGSPVYRLYNPNAGDHHYTLSAGERDFLVQVGWNYEGIGWYSDDNRMVPLYRQYNPNAVAGAHNFTTSIGERDNLVKAGWNDEGIAWYGVLQTSSVRMENDPAYASVEANVTLNGAGTGYHAKLVMGSTTTGSLASFGIQAESSPDYKKAHPNAVNGISFLMENVMYDAEEPGTCGKEYTFMGSPELNHTYKLRLSWTADNRFHCYVDDQEVFTTHATMAPPFIFAVEGSARMSGDYVRADFTGLRAKAGDSNSNFGLQGLWGEADEDYFGIHSSVTDPGIAYDTNDPFYTHGKRSYGATVHIEGTADVPGTDASGKLWNWDTTIQGLGHPISATVNIGQYGQ